MCQFAGTAATQYSRTWLSPPPAFAWTVTATAVNPAATRAASTNARGPPMSLFITTRRDSSRSDVDLATHVGPMDPAEVLVLPGRGERHLRRLRQRHVGVADRQRGREVA